MPREYFVLNLCLIELKNCKILLKEKQYLERQMIYIKNKLIDQNDVNDMESQSTFFEFEILYGMIKKICTEGAVDDEIEQLLSQIHKIKKDLGQGY